MKATAIIIFNTFCMVFFLLSALDLFFASNFLQLKATDEAISSVQMKNMVRLGYLGWTGGKNASIQHRKMHQGRELFDVQYTLNQYGYRPVPENADADRFVLFMGGSNAFGEGLPDHETIAAQLAQRVSRWQPYNLAYRAWGPSHAYMVANAEPLPDMFRQRKGVAFYLYYDFHALRVSGSSQNYAYNGGRIPELRLNHDGRVTFHGLQVDNHPWRFFIYNFVGKNAYLRERRVRLPIRLRQKDFDLMCAIFEQTAERLRDRIGLERFYILAITGQSLIEYDEVHRCPFDRSLVRVLRWQADKLAMPPMVLGDYHLNARGAARVAEKVERVLQQEFH